MSQLALNTQWLLDHHRQHHSRPTVVRRLRDGSEVQARTDENAAVRPSSPSDAPTYREAGSGPQRGAQAQQRPERLVDPDEPWETDDRTWYAVACHPAGLTHQQVADLWGVSRQAVQQVEARALAKLREALADDEDELREVLRYLSASRGEPTCDD